MSRQKARKAQNAASLIRPSMVVKLCADCGAYAIACYDGELNHVADYCPKHARKHGYCPECGNVLTQAERADPENSNGYCAAERSRYKVGLSAHPEWDDQDWDEWRSEDDL